MTEFIWLLVESVRGPS